MMFEELWERVCQDFDLPQIAKTTLPNSLSNKTKKRMVKHSSNVVGKAIIDSIEEINNGSVETIDALVYRKLNPQIRK